MATLKTQNNNDDTLNRLKELLLGSEIQTLHQLQDELNEIRARYDDPDETARRIRPVFNRLFNEEITRNDSELLTLLSNYLPLIVQEASRHDQDALSDALQPIVAPTLAKSVRNDKEKMTDLFYPLLGGMIAKYVTQSIKELTERINRKLEEGFSARALKRKIKAKLTGVSESELLIEEGNDAQLLALFVIHKSTGLLIASAQIEENLIQDAHMVAAMASAVKDFLNDSFDFRSNLKEEVQIVSYGDATLYIESAGSVYMVAFLDGEPDYKQRKELNVYFAELVRHYGVFFQQYDGDESAEEIVHIQEDLKRYINSAYQIQTPKSANATSVKWLGVIVLLALGGWGIYGWWQTYRIEKLEESLKRYGIVNAVVTEHNNTAFRLEGVALESARVKQALDYIRRQLHRPVFNALTWQTDAVASLSQTQRYTVQKQLAAIEQHERATIRRTSQAIRSLQTEQNQTLRTIALLQQQVKRLRRELQMLQNRRTLPQRIKKTLDATLHDSPYYVPQTGKINFAALMPFAPNHTDVRPAIRETLLTTIQRYLQALCSYKNAIASIEIEAYSDTSGSQKRNLSLTNSRAASIKKEILNSGIAKGCFNATQLHAVGYGERFPVIINGKEDANASRRIEIGYRLQRNNDETAIQH